MFFLVYMHAVLFLLNFYFTATGRVGKEHDTATVTEDEEATQQNMQNPERCEFDKGNYYQHLNPERAFCWDVRLSENSKTGLGLCLVEEKAPRLQKEEKS